MDITGVVRPLAFLLVLPLLAGCGGIEGCDAAVKTEPAPSYAGHYAATFTPSDAGPGPVTFDLTVDADGSVTGTALDGGTARTLGPSDKAGNVRNGCTLEGTAFHLSYPSDELYGKSLDATRGGRGSLAGTYGAALTDGASGRLNGELGVTKVVSTG